MIFDVVDDLDGSYFFFSFFLSFFGLFVCLFNALMMHERNGLERSQNDNDVFTDGQSCFSLGHYDLMLNG